MTFFKKATTTIAALAISMGLSAGVIAQENSGDVTIRVVEQEDAALTVGITDLTFDPIEYSLQDRPVNGSITVTAGDTRGSANGWNVTLSGEDFEAGTFSIDNLSLVNPQVSKVSGTDHPTEAVPTAQSAAPVNQASATILSAAPQTGAGNYSVAYTANLTVPAGTLVGTYESTLLVTINGEDPGDQVEGGE